MAWKIKFEREAEEDFTRLDSTVKRQIAKRLLWLEVNFDSIKPLALQADWSGYFKIRVGRWRITYTFSNTDQLIRIWHIDNRDKIYKRR